MKAETRKMKAERLPAVAVVAEALDSAVDDGFARLITGKLSQGDRIELLRVSLSPQQRRVLELFFAEGWSQDRIADELEISSGAVSSYIKLIREKVARVGLKPLVRRVMVYTPSVLGERRGPKGGCA